MNTLNLYIPGSLSRLLLSLGSCLFLFTACNKDELLNPVPTTLITDEAAFNTVERIENQVNGLYTNLKTGSFLGSEYFVISEIRAGDFISSNLNASTGATSYQMNSETTTDEVERIWAAGYQAINAANVFIDNMNLHGKEVTGEELGTQYIAEARLIRAVVYYYLLQLYARPFWDGNGASLGLPLRLTGNTGPGNYDLARSSVREVYDQILQDLDFAEVNLPQQYDSPFLNTVRAHKNTAIALKTRIYLHTQNYEQVLIEANKIVSVTAPFQSSTGVEHQLAASIHTFFEPPYTTTEAIFSLPFSNQDSPGLPLPRWYLPSSADGGTPVSNGNAEYSLNPNGIAADTHWSENDARRDFLLEGTSTGKLWLTKFSQASPHTDYVPVIRYAEVLLNLSEAITQTTQAIDPRAVSLLSAVRNRSDESTSFSEEDFSSAAALLNAINTERHIEFLGEGTRNFTIMRLGLDIPAKPAHSVPTISPSDYSYIFPIPNDELTLNNLMENN